MAWNCQIYIIMIVVNCLLTEFNDISIIVGRDPFPSEWNNFLVIIFKIVLEEFCYVKCEPMSSYFT